MSDPRSNTTLTTPDVERFVDGGRHPSLIEASLYSAKSISTGGFSHSSMTEAW